MVSLSFSLSLALLSLSLSSLSTAINAAYFDCSVCDMCVSVLIGHSAGCFLTVEYMEVIHEKNTGTLQNHWFMLYSSNPTFGQLCGTYFA